MVALSQGKCVIDMLSNGALTRSWSAPALVVSISSSIVPRSSAQENRHNTEHEKRRRDRYRSETAQKVSPHYATCAGGVDSAALLHHMPVHALG
eukprot:4424058-Pleurochrysis_carterae.AAC.1